MGGRRCEGYGVCSDAAQQHFALGKMLGGRSAVKKVCKDFFDKLGPVLNGPASLSVFHVQALGWALLYTSFSCFFTSWEYIWVEEISACPSIS